MNLPETQAEPARILVVDDENSTRLVMARALQLSGYHVDTAENGLTAVNRLSDSPYDVMLLDLNMPVLDGNQVLNIVREQYPDLQVIILTAHASLDSAITAVKARAVDYLLKPQSISQIKQAVETALKRRFNQTQRQNLLDILGQAMQTLQAEPGITRHQIPTNQATEPQVILPDFLFDPASRQITISTEDPGQGKSIVRITQLTANQSAILSCFLRRPNQVLTCQEICREALGYTILSLMEAENIVRPHIFKLRQKIEIDPSHPRRIQSVRGKGYLFVMHETKGS